MGMLYLHHLAPVLMCIIISHFSVPLICVSGVFFYVWVLHPIGKLDAKKIIDQQNWFWPYMVVGFIVKIGFWQEMLSLLPKQRELFYLVLLGLFLQGVGRWGLFIRLMIRYNIQNSFESRKCYWEPLCYLISYILVKNSRQDVWNGILTGDFSHIEL